MCDNTQSKLPAFVKKQYYWNVISAEFNDRQFYIIYI
jgi:hypothetical protein